MSSCSGPAYTVAAIGSLLLVARPLLCRSDAVKVSLISAAALAYAAPWPGLVSRRAAPHAALTLLWSLFCSRWSTPCLHLNFDRASHRLIRWVPPVSALVVVVVVVGVVGVCATGNGSAAPETPSSWSHLAAVLCRSFPAFAFLWYGAGNYFVNRIVPSAVAIAVPTLYLCWVDRTCRDDPVSCFAVNALLVLAADGYDKAAGLTEAYTSEFPRQLACGPGYAAQLFTAFVTAEHTMPARVIDDIRACFRVLEKQSTTIGTAIAHLFQGACRLDIVILYAFARITDEMFDNGADIIKQRGDLKLCLEFVNELFADRKTAFHVKRTPEVVKVDWTKYESRFNDTEMAVFRAFARIAFYLPAAPIIELFDDYQWDVDGKVFETEKDLLTYTANAGGINAVVTVLVIWYRERNGQYHDIVEKGKKEPIIQKLYKIGQAMQLVNIARDIITDSLKSGRCYIPLEYMDGDRKNDDAKALRQDKNPRSLGDAKLKRYADMLIRLANTYHAESEGVIRSLPVESRSLILALIDVYRAYISAIQNSSIYPARAKLSQWSKIKIVLYCLYVRSLHYVV